MTITIDIKKSKKKHRPSIKKGVLLFFVKMNIGNHIEEIMEYNRIVANINYQEYNRIPRRYVYVYEPEVFEQEEPKWAKEGKGAEQD